MTQGSQNTLSKRLRFAVREFVSVRPDLWSMVMRLRGITANVVGPDTDIVCEGYPRSGNSFAEAALYVTQGDIEIAHHRHVPAQLILAARSGKPALLLIRDPRDAVASAMLRRADDTTLARELEAWINFNKACLPIADQIVISDFPTTTRAFTATLAALVETYGNSVKSSAMDEAKLSETAYAEISKIAQSRGTTARLNYGAGMDPEAKAERDAALAKLRDEVEQLHATRLNVAREIYSSLQAKSVVAPTRSASS